MEITVKDAGDVKVLSFQGSLDTNTTPDAEAQVNLVLDDGTQKLLINFEHLDYISSTGLRLLLSTAKRLKRSQGALRVCCLNEMAQEVFDISGFSSILSVAKTEDAALSDF
jgi:anti-sigma B factor antagonist